MERKATGNKKRRPGRRILSAVLSLILTVTMMPSGIPTIRANAAEYEESTSVQSLELVQDSVGAEAVTRTVPETDAFLDAETGLEEQSAPAEEGGEELLSLNSQEDVRDVQQSTEPESADAVQEVTEAAGLQEVAEEELPVQQSLLVGQYSGEGTSSNRYVVPVLWKDSQGVETAAVYDNVKTTLTIPIVGVHDNSTAILDLTFVDATGKETYCYNDNYTVNGWDGETDTYSVTFPYGLVFSRAGYPYERLAAGVYSVQYRLGNSYYISDNKLTVTNQYPGKGTSSNRYEVPSTWKNAAGEKIEKTVDNLAVTLALPSIPEKVQEDVTNLDLYFTYTEDGEEKSIYCYDSNYTVILKDETTGTYEVTFPRGLVYSRPGWTYERMPAGIYSIYYRINGIYYHTTNTIEVTNQYEGKGTSSNRYVVPVGWKNQAGSAITETVDNLEVTFTFPSIPEKVPEDAFTNLDLYFTYTEDGEEKSIYCYDSNYTVTLKDETTGTYEVTFPRGLVYSRPGWTYERMPAGTYGLMFKVNDIYYRTTDQIKVTNQYEGKGTSSNRYVVPVTWKNVEGTAISETVDNETISFTFPSIPEKVPEDAFTNLDLYFMYEQDGESKSIYCYDKNYTVTLKDKTTGTYEVTFPHGLEYNRAGWTYERLSTGSYWLQFKVNDIFYTTTQRLQVSNQYAGKGVSSSRYEVPVYWMNAAGSGIVRTTDSAQVSLKLTVIPHMRAEQTPTNIDLYFVSEQEDGLKTTYCYDNNYVVSEWDEELESYIVTFENGLVFSRPGWTYERLPAGEYTVYYKVGELFYHSLDTLVVDSQYEGKGISGNRYKVPVTWKDSKSSTITKTRDNAVISVSIPYIPEKPGEDGMSNVDFYFVDSTGRTIYCYNNNYTVSQPDQDNALYTITFGGGLAINRAGWSYERLPEGVYTIYYRINGIYYEGTDTLTVSSQYAGTGRYNDPYQVTATWADAGGNGVGEIYDKETSSVSLPLIVEKNELPENKNFSLYFVDADGNQTYCDASNYTVGEWIEETESYELLFPYGLVCNSPGWSLKRLGVGEYTVRYYLNGLYYTSTNKIVVKESGNVMEPVISGPTALTGAVVDDPYTAVTVQAVASMGGTLSYRAQGLPEGMTIDAGTGAISGTPIQAGSFEVIVTVTEVTTDGRRADAAKTYELVVTKLPTPTLHTQALPAGMPGVAYEAMIWADVDEEATLTYSATGLPDGLSLDKNTGRISGTASKAGNYTVKVTVAAEGGKSVSAEYTLVMDATFKVMTTVLPDFVKDSPYVAALEANGTSLTWKVTSGSLPEGITLATDGQLSGTPAKTGSYSFTVQVSDGKKTASQAFSGSVVEDYVVVIPAALSEKIGKTYGWITADFADENGNVTSERIWGGTLGEKSDITVKVSGSYGAKIANICLLTYDSGRNQVIAATALYSGNTAAEAFSALSYGTKTTLTEAEGIVSFTRLPVTLRYVDETGQELTDCAAQYVKFTPTSDANGKDSTGLGEQVAKGSRWTVDAPVNAVGKHNHYLLNFENAYIGGKNEGMSFTADGREQLTIVIPSLACDYTLSGKAVQALTRDPVAKGRIVFTQVINGVRVQTATTTDEEGNYSIKLYKGYYVLATATVSSVSRTTSIEAALMTGNSLSMELVFPARSDSVRAELTLQFDKTDDDTATVRYKNALANKIGGDKAVALTITVPVEEAELGSRNSEMNQSISWDLWKSSVTDSLEKWAVASEKQMNLSWPNGTYVRQGRAVLDFTKMNSRFVASQTIEVQPTGGVVVSIDNKSDTLARYYMLWFVNDGNDTYVYAGKSNPVTVANNTKVDAAFECPGEAGDYKVALASAWFYPTYSSWEELEETASDKDVTKLGKVLIQDGKGVAVADQTYNSITITNQRYITKPNSNISAPESFTDGEVLSLTGHIDVDDGYTGKLIGLDISGDRNSIPLVQGISISGTYYRAETTYEHMTGTAKDGMVRSVSGWNDHLRLTLPENITLPCDFTIYATPQGGVSVAGCTVSADVIASDGNKIKDQRFSNELVGNVTMKGSMVSFSVPDTTSTKTLTANIKAPVSTTLEIYDNTDLIFKESLGYGYSSRGTEITITLADDALNRNELLSTVARGSEIHNLTARFTLPDGTVYTLNDEVIYTVKNNKVPTLVGQYLERIQNGHTSVLTAGTQYWFNGSYSGETWKLRADFVDYESLEPAFGKWFGVTDSEDCPVVFVYETINGDRVYVPATKVEDYTNKDGQKVRSYRTEAFQMISAVTAVQTLYQQKGSITYNTDETVNIVDDFSMKLDASIASKAAIYRALDDPQSVKIAAVVDGTELYDELISAEVPQISEETKESSHDKFSTFFRDRGAYYEWNTYTVTGTGNAGSGFQTASELFETIDPSAISVKDYGISTVSRELTAEQVKKELEQSGLKFEGTVLVIEGTNPIIWETYVTVYNDNGVTGEVTISHTTDASGNSSYTETITCGYPGTGPEGGERQTYEPTTGETQTGHGEGGTKESGGSTEGGSTEGGSTEGGSTEGGSTGGGSTGGGSTEGGSTGGGSQSGPSNSGGFKLAPSEVDAMKQDMLMGDIEDTAGLIKDLAGTFGPDLGIPDNPMDTVNGMMQAADDYQKAKNVNKTMRQRVRDLETLIASPCARKLSIQFRDNMNHQITHLEEMVDDANLWNDCVSDVNMVHTLADTFKAYDGIDTVAPGWGKGIKTAANVGIWGGKRVTNQKVLNVLQEYETLRDTLNLFIKKHANATNDKDCGNLDEPIHFSGLIDPSGVVYEAVLSNVIEGATVRLYTDGGNTSYLPNYDSDGNLINDQIKGDHLELFDASLIDSTNPLITGEDGQYQWYVPQGLWYVTAEKEGYISGSSAQDIAAIVQGDNYYWLPVLPAQMSVNIPMVSLEKPEASQIQYAEEGIFITFSKYMDESTLVTGSFKVTDKNGNVIPFTIVKLDSEQAPDNIDYNGKDVEGTGKIPSYTSRIELKYVESRKASDAVTLSVPSDTLKSYAGIYMDGMSDTHVLVTELFKDVSENKWYVEAVQYAYDHKIMSGVSADLFSPETDLTREQMVQILYNHSGRPKVSVDAKNLPFVDMKAGSWYVDAIVWANATGVTNGISATEFGVGQKVTREQVATFLYKYAKMNGFDLTTESGKIGGYPDGAKVDSWAKDGMDWAITQGVMNGKAGPNGANLLDPLATATRAECAQMMKNLLLKQKK